MRNTLTTLLTLALVLAFLTSPARSQDVDALLEQLRGKTQAPSRSEAELTEAYQKAVSYLLPLMSDEDVAARYSNQIALQDIAANAARPGAEVERQSLAKVLIETLEEREMLDTVRYWIVLQLERIGKGEAVPALAKMMTSEDPNLRDCARRALQANPDKEAGAALIHALSTASDATWKKGLIYSLGARREVAAVPAIAQALNSRDETVSAIAITALSHISGRDSARALIPVMRKPSGRLSADAAQGLLDIARERLELNDYGNAMGVYVAVYEWATQADPNEPKPVAVRAAALNGLMRCDVDGGAKGAAEAIQDEDPAIRAVAVKGARLAPTKEPATALAAMLPELDEASQIQVLGLVADRGDLSSVKYVRPALGSESESIQIAAIETLTAIGGDDAAEALLDVACQDDGPVQKAALHGLAQITGPLVDESISAAAASGDIRRRCVAIALLAQRRPADVDQTILAYAASENKDIASAAFKALAIVADLVEVAPVAKLLAQTDDGDIRKAAVSALKAVLSEARDNEAAATAVISQMRSADQEAKTAMLSCLSSLGGAAALEPVVQATKSPNEEMRDTAIRTLSNWPDYAAVQPLLDLASKNTTSLTHYVLATRGALRLIGASDTVPLDGRIASCFQAFDQARRDEEKRGAIAVMGSLPRKDVAERLLALAEQDTFKVEAGLAAVELASNMLRSDRDAATALAKKLREMNISDQVNERADAVSRGRRYRRR